MNKDKAKEKRAGFTPGAWVIELGKEHYLIEDKKGVRVALIENWTNATPKANARLIASAPEMYEVLTELLDTLEVSKGYGFDKEYAQVREVLAKVDGGAEG